MTAAPATTDTRSPWWPAPLYRDSDGYFRWRAGECTGDDFEKAAAAVGRNDAPALLFDLYYGLPKTLDVAKYPSVVASVWSGAEYPATNLEVGAWLDLFPAAGYTHDGLPAPQPTDSVTVYRGCHHERRFGMSWTSNLETARWFARRDRGKGSGNVYVHQARGCELLAYIHDGVGRPEFEYVINPEYLTDGAVAILERAA